MDIKLDVILCEFGHPKFEEGSIESKESGDLAVVFSAYVSLIGRELLTGGFIEFFSKNLLRMRADYIKNKSALMTLVRGCRADAPLNVTMLVLSLPAALISPPRAIEEAPKTKAELMKRVLSVLTSSIPYSYYALNAESLSFELTYPEIPSICRHAFYERGLLTSSVPILPDSPEDLVLYSEGIPVLDSSLIKPISRSEISEKISSRRGHPFLFKTGLDSFVPKYAKSIDSFFCNRDVYNPSIGQMFLSMIYSLIENSLGEALEKQRALKSQLAICNMGEPFGLGLFNVGERIPGGAFLGVYEGELTRNMTHDAHHYIMHGSSSEIQSSQRFGGYMGLMNHSSDGNTTALPIVFLILDEDKSALVPLVLTCLFTNKEINPREQVTFDYGSKYLFNGTATVFDSYGRELRKADKFGRVPVRDSITGLDLD